MSRAVQENLHVRKLQSQLIFITSFFFYFFMQKLPTIRNYSIIKMRIRPKQKGFAKKRKDSIAERVSALESV
jgi:hypothetical protein